MANKKGIIGTITGGFAESTRNVSAINKEHMAAIKADSKALFEGAKTPDLGLAKVKEAKRFGAKVKVIGQNIKDSAAEASAIENERREEIMSFGSYRTILGESDARRQAVMYNPLLHR